ncbi:MobF family relaxase [Propionicimonas sp.]|uniref:MobF family relaxase n=1 Tax=Propionicimonas sp. TaxID=1955623 RepID=UPI003D115FEE
MSLRRITAGSGYDYLTRQVAAMDSTERGHTGLASYYTEKGEIPGRWVGSGLAGIDGLVAGDVVTAEQMLALFGSGHHPLAAQRAAALADDPNATEQDLLDAIRLGQPFTVYANDISPYRVEVARRLQALNTTSGLPTRAKVGIDERARVRTEVGLEWFVRDFGRPPLNQRELAGHIARLSRQKTTAVAGFDLTFSPVKSVSALWALADPHLAATIERAHQAAVADALRFIETHALFSRTGAHGVRQVDVQGLIGAAFTHRDSRAGDPDLHTHVAVANKVRTLDGKWLSIDSRVLHKAITAASETYNTALEAHLNADAGVRFEARPDRDQRKRPVREIVGVAPELLDLWSIRRHRIVARQAALATAFQADHGRPPTPIEAIALAQQATLETREAKHEPRSLAEQRAAWHRQALELFGSATAIEAMVWRVLHPGPAAAAAHLTREWLNLAAEQILGRVELDRSAWQTWHVRAEALRHIRAENLPPASVEQVVSWLTDHILQHCSIPLSPPEDGIAEPDALRRADGASVYTVAGNRLYTSSRILEAERRILANAGRRDGRAVPDTAVDLALLETVANGVQLNPGQVALVRDMAASGARVQLAIAPAGAGKTTAMQALARAWTNDGGTVLGLAPSAVAAAGLGEQIGAHADTIAKLAWHLANGSPPAWMNQIGPHTLVIIDEAGMADTLSLDAVISHVLAAGGSVRLIGDDQQLAAIGAGGVLRDIQATRGALHLTELVRFTDPAEGSASLALRDGRPESLGFYLDRDRIKVGTPDTMPDQVFTGWAADRAAGQDSVMLAPTRDLVSQLNQRARTERLNGTAPGVEVDLADGNTASAGDVIITRRNDRRLRVNATDWVKNGDRWTIQTITPDGVRVQHTQTRRHITLPADYVTDWAELGYATTTHTAQGVTADTCHGLLTGEETRQQAYTMLTRGRHTNSCYLITSGDGDPHTLIHPEVIHPATAVDQLEQILVRDESPVSGTTALREAAEPRRLLGDAAARYSDAVVLAADRTTTPTERHTIAYAAERLLPGLTAADAWPALLARLLTLNADNRDPITALARAAADPITAGRDPAAILAWRLDDTGDPRHRGALPWLPTIPERLTQHPIWGSYLTARDQLVRTLTERLRDQVETSPTSPAWLEGLSSRPTTSLVADVEVWRAANQIPDTDRRPTGDLQPGIAAGRWQHHLDDQLARLATPALHEWGGLLTRLHPALGQDPFLPRLAGRLGRIASACIDPHELLNRALAAGPLPEEHAAAALWWRISGHLGPAFTQQPDTPHHLATTWLPHLEQAIGNERLTSLRESTWWPALVTVIEHSLEAGWTLDTITAIAPTHHDGVADDCQAWTWRLSMATQPPPNNADEPEPPLPAAPAPTPAPLPDEPPKVTAYEPVLNDPDAEADRILAIEALARTTMGPPRPDAAEIRRQQDRANAWHECPYTPDLLAHINQLATQFYEGSFPGSWAQPYLAERLDQDITGHPDIRPGYAPAGWTNLVQHLRQLGVSDDELLTSGVATRSRTGSLIDRFRDRLVLPITHNGQVLGFVARRNPVLADDGLHGPKYLNTPDTPLFHKGDQLYLVPSQTSAAEPILVEGPLDAIAVTLVAGTTHFGAAPLGTSLTVTQAAQLAHLGTQVTVATDADAAGRKAAERDYWTLTSMGISPRVAELPDGTDPADLLAHHTADTLANALRHTTLLGARLLDGIAHGDDHATSILQAARIIAAMPPDEWIDRTAEVADRGHLPISLVNVAVASAVQAWNRDPSLSAELSAAQPPRQQPPRRTRADLVPRGRPRPTRPASVDPVAR